MEEQALDSDLETQSEVSCSISEAKVGNCLGDTKIYEVVPLPFTTATSPTPSPFPFTITPLTALLLGFPSLISSAVSTKISNALRMYFSSAIGLALTTRMAYVP